MQMLLGLCPRKNHTRLCGVLAHRLLHPSPGCFSCGGAMACKRVYTMRDPQCSITSRRPDGRNVTGGGNPVREQKQQQPAQPPRGQPPPQNNDNKISKWVTPPPALILTTARLVVGNPPVGNPWNTTMNNNDACHEKPQYACTTPKPLEYTSIHPRPQQLAF